MDTETFYLHFGTQIFKLSTILLEKRDRRKASITNTVTMYVIYHSEINNTPNCYIYIYTRTYFSYVV